MACALRVFRSLGVAATLRFLDVAGVSVGKRNLGTVLETSEESWRLGPAEYAAENADGENCNYRNGYHYMPEEKVLICTCAKCGSTSMYEFVYREAMGHDWNYTNQPYVQDVSSERWAGKFKSLSREAAQEIMASNETLSFALVRDPRQRLISSWKSKAACDGGPWGTDKPDRARIVPKLLALAGKEPVDCLSFDTFMEAINDVHRMGKAHELNAHFVPQQYDCFRDFPPSQWSLVASVKDNAAAALLAKRFGDQSNPPFPQKHSSPQSEELLISDQAKLILQQVTAPEYSALGIEPVDI